MTTQEEIYSFIKRKKKQQSDYEELHKQFGTAKPNLRKQVKKLNRFGMVEIIVDNHKHIIMVKGDKPRPLIKTKVRTNGSN